MHMNEPPLTLKYDAISSFKEKKEKQICEHMNIISTNGRITCQDCGLELGMEYANSIFIGKNKPKKEGTHTYQYVGDPQSKRYHANLGSDLKLYGNFSRDGNGNLLKNVKTFDRLRKIHNSGKYSGTEFRTFTILNELGQELRLPPHILNGAGFRYKKLVASKIQIRNNATCMVFCLWDTIKAFKHPIRLQEVLSTFRKQGHRISKRSIMRDGCLYSEFLNKIGIKKPVPKKARDYLERHIGRLLNNKEIIKERLLFKGINKKPELYISELRKIAFQVLNQLEKRFMFKAYNPFYCAGACLYFSNLVLASYNKQKVVLTQQIISDICGILSYELRSIYIKEFKPLLSELKKELEG